MMWPVCAVPSVDWCRRRVTQGPAVLITCFPVLVLIVSAFSCPVRDASPCSLLPERESRRRPSPHILSLLSYRYHSISTLIPMAVVHWPAFDIREQDLELESDSSSSTSEDRNDWSGIEVADREWESQLLLHQVLKNRVIDLRNRELRAIPDELVTRDSQPVDTLILSHNNIRELPVQFGRTLTFVTELNLDGNSMTILPDSIGQLTGLNSLSVKLNQISSLPDSIGRLSKLTILSLEKNRLTHLPEEIASLTKLKFLSLCDNDLQSLPHSFGRMTHLTELDVTNNQLSDLSDGFGSLSCLTTLLAANNRLTIMPASFASLPSLTRIDLSCNKLTSLCNSLRSAPILEILCLDCNPQLAQLPDWIGCMPNMGTFSCRSCSLTGIPLPESFGHKSRRLTKLDMSENRMTRLPASLMSLSELEVLNLGTDPLMSDEWVELKCNKFATLPKDFGLNFRQMRELRLNNCSLTSLPKEMGNGLCCLQLLDLDGNFLSSLPDSLCNLSQLRTLRLRCNKLQGLPDAVGKWISLTELNLADNDITALPISFKELASLQDLHLAGNRLTSCPGLLSGLCSLKKLDGLTVSASLFQTDRHVSRCSPIRQNGKMEETGSSSESWEPDADAVAQRHGHRNPFNQFKVLPDDYMPYRGYANLIHRNKIRPERRDTRPQRLVPGQFDDVGVSYL